MIYAKAGYMEVDVNTNEVLATGGSYGNTSLDGYVSRSRLQQRFR